MNWYKLAKSQKKQEEDSIMAKIPKSCQHGDCYCAAGRYIMDNGRDSPSIILVHGEVTGQGKIQGIKYGHAWIEEGDNCIDLSRGRNLVIPKVVYYALGRIEESKVHKYNYEQFQKKVLETGHWGPWDLIRRERQTPTSLVSGTRANNLKIFK